MWNVDFYRTEANKSPVKDFLESLDTKMRAKALHELNLLEELGMPLREPHSKPIKDGLFELRIKAGSDISRIFYFFWIGNITILTNEFVKKTPKTPKRKIDKALKYKLDYERRYINEWFKQIF